MNALEDAFWSARARALALREQGRAAVLVKRGRRLAEAFGDDGSSEVASRAILDAPRTRGGTLYLGHAPDHETITVALRAGIVRIVVPHAIDLALAAEAARVGILVDVCATESDGSRSTSSPAVRRGLSLVNGGRPRDEPASATIVRSLRRAGG